MGRRRAAALTDAELSLMEILWSQGPSTVGDVMRLLPAPQPSYNSIQTRLNILENKGYATRTFAGRAFRYRSAIDREHVLSSAVSRLVSRFFHSGSALALRLIADHDFSQDELGALEAAIAKKQGKP
jgi:predicted transcriptional regulator